MNTKIVYFSQTGNTKKVAEAIARGIKLSGKEVHLERLQDASAEWLRDADLIGIGTPVFYYKQPFNVTDFLTGLDGLEGKYAFFFITEGGHQANTLLRMTKILKKKGITSIDTFSCFGYDTFPVYIGKNRQLGHPDARELRSAGEFGASLFVKLELIKRGRTDLVPKIKKQRGKYHRLSLFLQKPVLDALFPKKDIDEDRCTRCEKCVKECPVHAITMGNYPMFGHECIYCYYCQRICPEQAIVCDWRFISKFVKD
jgi:flavodoxin/ferredoxin